MQNEQTCGSGDLTWSAHSMIIICHEIESNSTIETYYLKCDAIV